MRAYQQTAFAATASALLCVPMAPAMAAGPLLFAPLALGGHVLGAVARLATLPLVAASAAWSAPPPAAEYSPPGGYYGQPAYYPRSLCVLRCIAGLLPARQVVSTVFSAPILWTPAWLLRTGHTLLWLLWCPSLLPIARLLLSPAVSIATEPRAASQAWVEDLLARRLWNCAIASWKPRQNSFSPRATVRLRLRQWPHAPASPSEPSITASMTRRPCSLPSSIESSSRSVRPPAYRCWKVSHCRRSCIALRDSFCVRRLPLEPSHCTVWSRPNPSAFPT